MGLIAKRPLNTLERMSFPRHGVNRVYLDDEIGQGMSFPRHGVNRMHL